MRKAVNSRVGQYPVCEWSPPYISPFQTSKPLLYMAETQYVKDDVAAPAAFCGCFAYLSLS